MRIPVGKGSEESFVSFMDKVSGNSKRVSAKEDEPGAKGSTKTDRAEPSAHRDAAGRPKSTEVPLNSGQAAKGRRAAPGMLERDLCHGSPR